MHSHYAVVTFAGDPEKKHPDPELRGKPPSLELVGGGTYDFCWDLLTERTAEHPLRPWEAVEVLAREESAIRLPPEEAT